MRCLNCAFYTPATRCHRMPQPVPVSPDHWCGEFVEADPASRLREELAALEQSDPPAGTSDHLETRLRIRQLKRELGES